MKTLPVRIVEDFKAGHELSTKLIKDFYASSDNHASSTIKFLFQCCAIKNSGRKDGKATIYIIQRDAYERVTKKDKAVSKFRKKTNKYLRCDVKELTKTHNPLVLKFDALLAGVRA